jgi:hypothetical protein
MGKAGFSNVSAQATTVFGHRVDNIVRLKVKVSADDVVEKVPRSDDPSRMCFGKNGADHDST